MTLTTNFYHKSPTGMVQRLPLAPLHHFEELRSHFKDLWQILQQVEMADSYASLWEEDAEFRRVVMALLELNGLGSWSLSLGEKIALCIGIKGHQPVLARYNLIGDQFCPISREGIEGVLQGMEEEPPKLIKKRMADVFPLINCEGESVYPRGLLAIAHREFEDCYLALATEAQELQNRWLFADPAAIMLYGGEELRAHAYHLLRLFGLEPSKLNLHQVTELALAYNNEPGLCPQLAGIVPCDGDFQESGHDGIPIPETDSTLHFLLGRLAGAGVDGTTLDMLLKTCTIAELESFQHGIAWDAEKAEAEQERRERDAFVGRLLDGQIGGMMPCEFLPRQPNGITGASQANKES
ncbi:MAG: hypothetical protein F6J87_14960 [Spirulina sp. SIO3F2]|nr:hypothetical protein [Spirulina sp. SIO3F2]